MESNNRNIKILHILWSGTAGGAEKNVSQIVTGLNKNGFTMDVLFLNDIGYWGKFLLDNGIKVYCLKIDKATSLKTIFFLYRFFKRSNYDFYHDHISVPYTKLLLKLIGKRVIYTLHNAPYLISRMGKIKKFLINNFADYYIAPSETMKNYFKKEFNRNSYLIYHGVEIPEFVIRKINKSDIIIGTLTHLEEVKGNDILIDAINILYKKGCKNFKLVIVGKGSQYNYLIRKIKEYGLEKIVIITDNVIVDEFLREIDIYISTSRGESLGISLIEAMSYCLPVVCSNIEPFLEIVDDGKSGFICSHKPDEIAFKLEKLINNLDLRLEFGKRGYSIVKEKFNIEKTLQQYKNFYKMAYYKE